MHVTSMPSVRIIGRGYLGSFLGNALGIEPESSEECDWPMGSNVIINCAGMTGRPNIDACEDRPERTHYLNVTRPWMLAQCTRYLVHLSSGCIFDGPSPERGGWTETDEPNMLQSVYCRSKREAERQLLSRDNTLCLRIRMPLDDVPHPRNLITKIRAYDRVIDAENSMTYLPDLARVMRQIIERRPVGLLHVVSPDTVSPYELRAPGARPECLQSLEGITRVRRSNCQLSVARLAAFLGEPPPPLRPRLQTILGTYDYLGSR